MNSVFSRLESYLSINSGDRGGGGLRICGLSDLRDNFRYGMSKDEVESVLSKICKIYHRAKLLDMGASRDACCSCLGLLDPVANIRFNYLVAGYLAPPAPAPAPADGGGRRQGADKEEEDMMNMMAQRSLDGLVAFLTRLFPYLPDAEALAYIDAAAADPLVAALLVIDSRALTVDSFVTATSVEIALRSAAAAAKHPHPEGFVRGWKLASLSPQGLAAKLASHMVEFTALNYLNKLLLQTPSPAEFQLEDPWKLAKDRRLPSSGGNNRRAPFFSRFCTGGRARFQQGRRLPPARGARKRILLSMIHGYYLKALAVLPKQQLTETYHRSLLVGGHCYGPLDPVSNIIVNTIWYEQCFPATQVQQPLSMISTACLWRIAARSLYGLVSFLCNRRKDLTPDQALQRLLVARANLTVADPQQLRDDDHGGKKTGGRRRRGATVIEAYLAAAQSARHPSAVLQAEFLGTPRSARNLLSFSEMLLSVPVRDGCTLTKEQFDCLLTLFRIPSVFGMPNPQQEGPPTELGQRIYLQTCQAKNSFWLKHDRVRSKVEAALRKFNETAVHKYNLHVICGVNELVDDEFSLDPEVRAYNPWTPYKYHYSHINFLATCEGSLAPKLFFAECSNHGTSTCWCVPVLLHPDAGISLEGRPDVGVRPEAARCIYCEHEMGRIWHPITEKFHGRDDFDKFGGGSKYSNNKLMIHQGYKVAWVDSVADDAIYSNFCAGDDNGPGHAISDDDMALYP